MIRLETTNSRFCRPGCPIIIGQIDPSSSHDDNRLSFGKHQPGGLERIMPGPAPRRSRFIFALTLLAALQAATPAWAWGRLGHRVISRLAEKNMTPAAAASFRSS